MTFSRVLVANRGEIRSPDPWLPEAGLESGRLPDADERALHVRLADRAERLDRQRLRELSQHRGVDCGRTAQRCPGDPSATVSSLERERIRPRASNPPASPSLVHRLTSSSAWGSKIGARELMTRAGVLIVPGETPADQSDDGTRPRPAARISGPHQGVGWRWRERHAHGPAGEDPVPLIGAARREAAAALVTAPSTWNASSKNPATSRSRSSATSTARSCTSSNGSSLQRRHQKIIEESPSPALTAGLRERMGAAAVAAGLAAGYRNAGTVEFLVEGEGDDARFYFLEMNTRPCRACRHRNGGRRRSRAGAALAAWWREFAWTQQLAQRGHAIRMPRTPKIPPRLSCRRPESCCSTASRRTRHPRGFRRNRRRRGSGSTTIH